MGNGNEPLPVVDVVDDPPRFAVDAEPDAPQAFAVYELARASWAWVFGQREDDPAHGGFRYATKAVELPLSGRLEPDLVAHASAIAVFDAPLRDETLEVDLGVNVAGLGQSGLGGSNVLRVFLGGQPHLERFLDQLAHLTAGLGCSDAHGPVELVVGKRDGDFHNGHPTIWIAGWPPFSPAADERYAPAVERWELPPAINGPTDSGRDLWVEDGLLTADPVAGAERLPGRFALPGLVDSHFHMAFGYGAVPLSEEEVHALLRAQVGQGVLLVRDLGAPNGISLNLPAEPDFPRVIAAGQHLAPAGGFIEGSHLPFPVERLVEGALAEVDAGAAWVKIMADGGDDGHANYPMDNVREMADAVHARGARVAAHTEGPVVRELAHTGVDSIEHGSAMDEPTLREMARSGMAWAPTTNLYLKDLAHVDEMLAQPDLEPARRLRLAGWRQNVEGVLKNVVDLLPVAAGLGVTLLASTDTVGTVVEDVERIAAAGVDPATAIGTATWDARRYLGAAGLEPGAPADVVTFDDDPRDDPSVLGQPVAVVLGGRRVR